MAATAGITTSEILQVADWSSATTFKNSTSVLYRTQKTKWPLGQQFCLLLVTSNLHIDIETERFEV